MMGVTNSGDDKMEKPILWIFFFRQSYKASTLHISHEEDIFKELYSCRVVILNYFMVGLYTGAPTVIIPQMRKEANSTDIATPEIVSWLSSIAFYSGIPWAVILPMIAYRYGRKIPLILVSVSVLVGNLIFYCSRSVTELIISQATLGIFTGSVLTISIMVMSEYTSPKYRGIFLTFKGATLYWGVWVSNAIGTFFQWRDIGVLVFICAIYNFILSILSTNHHIGWKQKDFLTNVQKFTDG